MLRTEPSTHETLLAAVCSRPFDAQGWSRFVFLYGPHVLAWCRRYGLQDADARDVAQEVLFRFMKQAERFQYDRSRKFRGYLRTITHAAWCDWVERRWAGIEAGDDAPTAEALDRLPARDDLLARLEARYDRELFELAMRRVERRVEPRTWEAFRLLAIERLRGKEVADRLGMQLGSAFAARHKVQRLIRETVQQLDAGVDA